MYLHNISWNSVFQTKSFPHMLKQKHSHSFRHDFLNAWLLLINWPRCQIVSANINSYIQTKPLTTWSCAAAKYNYVYFRNSNLMVNQSGSDQTQGNIPSWPLNIMLLFGTYVDVTSVNDLWHGHFPWPLLMDLHW